MNSNLQAIADSSIIQAALAIGASVGAAQADIDALGQKIGSLTFANDNLTGQVEALKSQLAAAANISIFDALETLPALVAGGSVANSAGNPGVAGDAQATPSATTAFRDIFPNGAYQDKYWYWKLGADATKATFVYEGRFMLPSPLVPQALELDIQQVIGGQCYNSGLQMEFAGNRLRIWDRSTKAWQPTGLTCPRWSANSWHSFKLETHRDSTNVYYDAVTLDGIKSPLTQVFPAVPFAVGAPDILNCAIQTDANSHGDSYRLYIDGIRFTAKG